MSNTCVAYPISLSRVTDRFISFNQNVMIDTNAIKNEMLMTVHTACFVSSLFSQVYIVYNCYIAFNELNFIQK